MVTIETDRLILIALTRQQLEMALYNTGELAEQLQYEILEDVFSDESRQAMMIKISRMDHVDPRLHPWYTYFLIVEKHLRRAIGVCGFKGAPTPYGSVEVGYAMHENYRNKGYMTETVRALIDWAFTHDTCLRVTAETLRDNFASQRVLQKSGMYLDRASENMLYWKIEKRDRAASQPDEQVDGAGK